MSDEIQPPKNTPVELSEKLILSLTELAKKGAKAALILQAPFFGWPVISNVTDYLIALIADTIAKVLREQTAFLIIDVQTQLEAEAYRHAVEVLRADIKNEAAQKAFDEKLKRLIKFGSHLALVFMLASCSSIPINDAEFCGDRGELGAKCFNSLSDKERSLDKYLWDQARFGMICTAPETFAESKASLEKLCALTKRCIYKKETEKFFQKIDSISK